MIVRWCIRGRVQGVFMRANIQKQALMLNLNGFARNRQDGTVECLVEGEREAIESLRQWILSGPGLSEVEVVEELFGETGRAPLPDGFVILPTR